MNSINSGPSAKSGVEPFRLNSRQFIIFQFSVVTTLVILGFFTYLLAHAFGLNIRELQSYENFLSIFDVGDEESIPTWFATINLLMSSCLLFCIFSLYKNSGKSINRYWLYLAILFLLLSVDESAVLHERTGYLAWYLGYPHEIFRSHAWLPFGILFVVLVGAASIPFLRSISYRLALLMALSGIIFVSGAIGFEFVAASMEYTEFAEKGTFPRNMVVLVEESLEMYGIALFNSVLFCELAKRDFQFRMLFH